MTLPVTAVLVTRGDVDLEPIVSTLIFDRLIVWNNAAVGVEDMGAYGRYAALDHVETSHVYYQDDDCTVSADAQAGLVWQASRHPERMVSNMREHHNAGMPHLHIGFLSSIDPIVTRPMRLSDYERVGPSGWQPGTGFPVKGELLRRVVP